MLRPVADGVLIHESEFCQSNAVVVQGRAGVLLIDPGVLGDELATIADDLEQAFARERLSDPGAKARIAAQRSGAN